MSVTNNTRSLPEILTDVLTQLTTLLRKEGQLARAEISENLTKVAAGLGFVAGGAVLLIPALVVLLQAAVAALTEHGLASYWSALIVGGVVLVLGLVIAYLGANRLKIETIMPTKTIHQLQRDASVAKEQVRQSDDLHRAA